MMSRASAWSRWIPSASGPGNTLRDAWDRLRDRPFGVWLFNRAIAWSIPYTGGLGSRIVELRPGYSRIELVERRAVRNHLRSIHAVAMANLIELAGNAALQYSLPDDARFIVSRLCVEYSKKARGTITAVCECPIPESSERREYEIPIVVTDAAGDVVCRGTLTSLVGPKKRRDGGAAS